MQSYRASILASVIVHRTMDAVLEQFHIREVENAFNVRVGHDEQFADNDALFRYLKHEAASVLCDAIEVVLNNMDNT